MNPQILWSLQQVTKMGLQSTIAWASDQDISDAPQILDIWISRSMYFYISTSLDSHISLFMHCQAIISADPQMSVSLRPSIL